MQYATLVPPISVWPNPRDTWFPASLRTVRPLSDMFTDQPLTGQFVGYATEPRASTERQMDCLSNLFPSRNVEPDPSPTPHHSLKESRKSVTES